MQDPHHVILVMRAPHEQSLLCNFLILRVPYHAVIMTSASHRARFSSCEIFLSKIYVLPIKEWHLEKGFVRNIFEKEEKRAFFVAPLNANESTIWVRNFLN